MIKLLEKKSGSPLGGRPKEIGTLVFDDDGKRGLFVGYFGELGIAIDPRDLTDILKRNYMEYKVRVEITKEIEPFSLWRFFARYFIPKQVKAIIKEQVEF